MSSIKKFKVRVSDYQRKLRSVNEDSAYLVQLHYYYIVLIETVFKHIFLNGQIERKDEFILDFKIFIEEMISKYSSASPYGYSPRSPEHKRLGLSHDQKLTDKPRIQSYDLNDDDDWREYDEGHNF